MIWWNEVAVVWLVVGLVGVIVVGLLWWALSDLVLATVELPFSERLSRWRRRVDRSGDDRNASADASA